MDSSCVTYLACLGRNEPLAKHNRNTDWQWYTVTQPTFSLESPWFIDLTIYPVFLQNLKTISVQCNTMLKY